MKKLRHWIACFGLALLSLPVWAGTRSAGDLDRIWKQKTLRLCWAQPNQRSLLEKSQMYLSAASDLDLNDPRPAHMQAFRRLMTKAYSREWTGLTLAGFGPCPSESESASDYDVYLADVNLPTQDGSPGLSSVGDEETQRPWYSWRLFSGKRKSFMGIDFNLSGRALAPTHLEFLNTLRGLLKGGISYETAENFMSRINADLNLFTQLHEFGHILGLRHESSREDAAATKAENQGRRYAFCQSSAEVDTKERSSDRLSTGYDVFSIMNYCMVDMIQFYHQAVFLCANENELELKWASGNREKAIRQIFGMCGFVRKNRFPIGLTPTDQLGLQHLYGRGPIVTGPIRRSSAQTESWIELFNRMHVLNDL